MQGPYILTIAADANLERVGGALTALGLWARRLESAPDVRMIEIDARSRDITPAELATVYGVTHVAGRASEHPLVDAAAGKPVRVGARLLGPGAPAVVLAGPCAVETESQIERIAATVARAGAGFLRGSAFKPRSSPYSFQGHGAPALRWLRAAADRNGLGVVTEVMAPEQVGPVSEVADLMQIGARNMQNFSLLKAVGAAQRPVLLKRGPAATVEEWLLAAEYCLAAGAAGVVLCERGIRGFDPSMRNLLDLGTVALLAHAKRLPILVDPSHATGRRDLIPPLSRAALAAGAHGLLIEVHDEPASALSDGPQALSPAELDAVMQGVT